MAYTLSERVHVDLRVNGTDLSGDFGPGEVDLPQAVADLLVDQGIATEVSVSKKAVKSTSTNESTEA